MLLQELLFLFREQKLFNPAADGFEGQHSRCALAVHLDDVESKLGAEDVAHLARPEREGDRVKLVDHMSAREKSEIAAPARAIGRLIRQLFERLAGLEFLVDLGDGAVGGIFAVAFVDVLDNVRGVNGLFGLESLAMLPVILDKVFAAGPGGMRSHAGY